MTGGTPDARPAIPLEEVARAAIELAAQPELSALVARFLEFVRGWAAPSAILAAAEDSRAEAGWRLIPALCVGSGPLGVERLLAQLVEETPEGRRRPVVVQPAEEAPGVRVRDNWILPWWHDAESGVLILRGVPRGCPPNLGEALFCVSGPVWPRLLGSPAARVEALGKDLQAVAERLKDQMARQLERLQAARPSEASTDAPARIADLEAQLEAVRRELRSAVETREQGQARLAELEQKARTAEAERDGARAELGRASARTETLRSEQAATAGQLEQVRRIAEAAAQSARRAEEQRDEASAEAARLSKRVETLLAEQGPAAARLEELRRAAESAGGKAREAEQERDQARAEVARLSSRPEGPAAAAASAEQVEELQRTARTAQAKALMADEALAAAQGELAARDAALKESGRLLEEAQAALAEAKARSERAEAPAAAVTERPPEAPTSLGATGTALRRTPFVPRALRAALEQAAPTPQNSERPEAWLRIAVLDRDPLGPESLVAELEDAGLHVWVANHPEELAILVRTADVLHVAVCDVMAFRPDQNVAGLLRSWEKDRPGLQFYLSRDQGVPAEVERARRIPMSLLAGQLQRPIHAAGLVAALQILSGKPPSAKA